MNRLRILLISTALITGSSALASAQEHYQTGFSVQVRVGGHDGENRGGFYAYANGDHDRDNRYVDRDNRYVDRDNRYVDRDDRYRGRDRDDRWKRDNDDRRGWNYNHDGDRR